jgi:hypothetical protein
MSSGNVFGLGSTNPPKPVPRTCLRTAGLLPEPYAHWSSCRRRVDQAPSLGDLDSISRDQSSSGLPDWLHQPSMTGLVWVALVGHPLAEKTMPGPSAEAGSGRAS